MATGADHDFARLARMAKERRQQLSLALNDANAKAGGTSKGTWQRVEKGEPIRATNYAKFDALLKWAPGSCMAVLEGREPIPVTEVAGAVNAVKSEVPPEAIDAKARDVIQLAMIATTSGLTADEIRALSDRVVQDLKTHGLI